MSNSSISANKDEFDMAILFEFLLRNKFKLFMVTFISIFFSTIYAVSKKHIWEGQFQIVLSQNANQSSIQEKGIQLNNLINSSNLDLKTDVEILKSPSVLASVFDFVQEDKRKKGMKKGNLVYSNWLKKNLSISLERGTSVLNLSYRDKDKTLIIPVLEKISKEYKSYSGRKRRKDINSALEFTTKQIKKFEQDSAESYVRAQKFAIENKFDLPSLERQEKLGLFSLEEQISITLQNIQYAEANLKKLKLINDDSNLILYSLPNDKFNNPFDNQVILEEIDKNNRLLSLAKSIYVEDDKYLKNLKERKAYLNKSLKDELILYLEAQKLYAEAQLESLIKPEEVLKEYRKILGKATKDKKTLDQLNSQLNFLSLEKAKNNDPWELITKPTLLPEPVAPSKKRIVAIFSLFGISLGGLVIRIIENKKGVIYSLKELEKLLNSPIISIINLKDSDNLEKSLDIFIAGIVAQKLEKIGILNLGPINKKFLKKINSYLNNNYSGKFLISNNLFELKSFNNLVLSIEVGSTLKKSYNEMLDNIKFQNKNIICCLAISKQTEK